MIDGRMIKKQKTKAKDKGKTIMGKTIEKQKANGKKQKENSKRQDDLMTK